MPDGKEKPLRQVHIEGDPENKMIDVFSDDYYMNQTLNNIRVNDVFSSIGKSSGIDPSFLYSNAYQEGFFLPYGGGDLRTGQYQGQYKQGYDYDAARLLGLDNIGQSMNSLIESGYLPKDFSDKMVPYNFVTNKGEKTLSGAFKDPSDALVAMSAYLRKNRDEVKSYSKERGINLSPMQEDFFTSAFYNSGASGKAMMESYNRRGYLKSDEFITNPQFDIPKNAYRGVYDNVAPRIRRSNEIRSRYNMSNNPTNSEIKQSALKDKHGNVAQDYKGKDGLLKLATMSNELMAANNR